MHAGDFLRTWNDKAPGEVVVEMLTVASTVSVRNGYVFKGNSWESAGVRDDYQRETKGGKPQGVIESKRLPPLLEALSMQRSALLSSLFLLRCLSLLASSMIHVPLSSIVDELRPGDVLLLLLVPSSSTF